MVDATPSQAVSGSRPSASPASGEPPAASVASGLAAGSPGASRVEGPPSLLPTPQLPVVDLIGLRFSLQHLRLVGYGLLAVWVSELVNLLTSPGLGEIGSRLHYTSQFLDLSPILLVAIGLIAFQGGLRRGPLELALLPLLLALLPLLSALHFFLAPVSVANAITLVQKQQQISLDQIGQVDRQFNRAASILRDSDSITSLLSGLQRIPGLQVRVPEGAPVQEARQEVRRSLERERERVRERIQTNISNSREAFLRRAITNASLALLMGLLLWGLHHGAMREMELAIPFLDWVLVQGELSQQPQALQELLAFQRACVALGWFSLLERSLRLVRRVVRRPSAQQLAEEEAERQRQAQQPPANPFDRPPLRRLGLSSAPQPLLSFLRPSFLSWGSALPDAADAGEVRYGPMHSPAEGSNEPGDPAADGAEDPHPLAEELRRSEQAAQRRELRRRQRDLQRYQARRRRLEQEGLDPFLLIGASDPGRLGADFDPDALASGPRPELGAAAGAAEGVHDPIASADAVAEDSSALDLPSPEAYARRALSPRQRRALARDHERARAALRRMAHSEALFSLHGDFDPLEQELREEIEQELASSARRIEDQPPLPPPRGLGRLWHWFVTHL